MDDLKLTPANRYAAVVRVANDHFRQTFGTHPLFRDCPGHVVLTEAVQALDALALAELCTAVRDFADWTNENDPYAEHDFGKVGDYFWKLDYYNRTLEAGADDPADLSATVRVLFIMHVSEY